MSWLKKRLSQARAERKEDNQRKTEIDNRVKAQEKEEYYKQYESTRMANVKARATQRAQGGNRLGGVGKAIGSVATKKNGHAAFAGLDFLSGDMFGTAKGQSSQNVSAGIEDLMNLGPPIKRHAPQASFKPKRTTINTGGKRITITEQNPLAEGKQRREKTTAENIEDLLGL
jgi:hypothetical protein